MDTTYTSFAGTRRIATGDLATVVRLTKQAAELDDDPILVFADDTGKQVDVNLHGTIEEAVAREAPPRGPGRPKLGVVAREVTLLPRHWEWLEAQQGGASAALRRLVEAARKAEPDPKARRDAAGRFLWVMAGNLPGFEEATRALYAGDRERFAACADAWPADVREHALRLWEG